MYRIKTFNKISPMGLNRLEPEHYTYSDNETDENGILVRSAKLHDYPFPASLLAIARAGVGVNNIPIDRCSESGIAVFNTPGANANAVKELVLCAMLIGSRDVDGGIQWVRQQVESGVDITTVVEKGKSAFVGPELFKKTLGVIGLGAIGSLVANVALDMGMDVYGYDPFLSVDAALRLDRHIHVVKDINELYKRADYITIHIHYTEKTAHMIDEKAISAMKRGVRFINLARGEIVDDDAMLAALDTGRVATYVTDFPNNRLVGAPHVVAMPHLGASTPESEQNCAIMAVDQLKDYLENGNIRNSVNFPSVSMERSGVMRMCIIHKNVPAMLANITTLLSKDGVNVENLSNKSKGDYAYTMVDLGSKVADDVIEDVKHLPNVIRVRVIE
ncbi:MULTISPECIES: phosphoglycerate dehydrogenase [environmental samples]|uniref:phosphoglycerate dehydrogenase n=1 Tax=environmental samples TaxID=876090 RepID=UPI0003363F98|nr:MULTISPECIES: phosphoglycerate dehydrogenase [environmental samples]CDC68344.1 putative oxidoreductase [Oscillibacter sp. CAG:155]